MFNPSSQNSKTRRRRRLLTAPAERIVVPERPQHQWTKHQTNVLVALMARQVHTSKDELYLPAIFNERVDGLYAHNHEDLPDGEIHAKCKEILATRPAFGKMLMRMRTKRLTRVLKRSYERGLKVSGARGREVVGGERLVLAAKSGSNAVPLGTKGDSDGHGDGEGAAGLEGWGGVAPAEGVEAGVADTVNLEGWGEGGAEEQAGTQVVDAAALEGWGEGEVEGQAETQVVDTTALDGWGEGLAADQAETQVADTTALDGWGGLGETNQAATVDAEMDDAGWGVQNNAVEAGGLDDDVVDAGWRQESAANTEVPGIETLDAAWGAQTSTVNEEGPAAETVDASWEGSGEQASAAGQRRSALEVAVDSSGGGSHDSTANKPGETVMVGDAENGWGGEGEPDTAAPDMEWGGWGNGVSSITTMNGKDECNITELITVGDNNHKEENGRTESGTVENDKKGTNGEAVSKGSMPSVGTGEDVEMVKLTRPTHLTTPADILSYDDESMSGGSQPVKEDDQRSGWGGSQTSSRRTSGWTAINVPSEEEDGNVGWGGASPEEDNGAESEAVADSAESH